MEIPQFHWANNKHELSLVMENECNAMIIQCLIINNLFKCYVFQKEAASYTYLIFILHLHIKTNLLPVLSSPIFVKDVKFRGQRKCSLLLLVPMICIRACQGKHLVSDAESKKRKVMPNRRWKPSLFWKNSIFYIAGTTILKTSFLLFQKVTYFANKRK